MSFFDFFKPSGSTLPSKAPSPDQPRELLLYKTDFCPFCIRVFRSIDDLGLKVPMADLNADLDNRAALFEVTGRTTVPCLFIDGQPLFESVDIIKWLTAYKTGGATL